MKIAHCSVMGRSTVKVKVICWISLGVKKIGVPDHFAVFCVGANCEGACCGDGGREKGNWVALEYYVGPNEVVDAHSWGDSRDV